MRRVWLLSIALLSSGLSADPLILAVGEWPPYFSQNLREGGVFAHIVKEAFARKGLTVMYEFYPWARALSLAQAGDRVAATPGWIQTPERSESFLFSDPVVLSREVLFYRADKSIVFTRVEDLQGLRIGAALGYSYGPEFDAAEKAGVLTVERTSSDDQNLRKLLAGRLDAVALNRVVGFELLSHFSAAERRLIVASDRSLAEKQSRMAVGRARPGAEALIRTFNEGLAEVIQDGTARRWLAAAENGEYHLPPH